MSLKLEMDLALVFKKFYCHKCGERLSRNSNTRTVKRGDSDYSEHNTLGRTHMLGDVQLTEYGLKCTKCGRSVDVDKQRLIARIQKKLGKRIITDDEYEEWYESAEKAQNRSVLIKDIIIYTLFCAVFVAAVVFFAMK